MIILKTIQNSELDLLIDGKLVYKRFLDSGTEKIFDTSAYENKRELIKVNAKLKVKRTDEGGRQTGFHCGYRPNHVFEYKDNSYLQTYIGDIQFDNQDTIRPGEEKNVTVRFLREQPTEKHLNIGRKWWIHEGSRVIGEAEIISIDTDHI